MFDFLTVAFLWTWIPTGMFIAFLVWFGSGPR